MVLFGQPELDQRLARPELRQLRQRITFSYRLRPLSRAQLNAYVRHRLEIAGTKDPALFGDDALRILYRGSRGIPRLANILCHKALLAAFGPGHPRVERGDALAAISDTDSTTLPLPAKLWLLTQENLGLVCLALVLSLGVAYLLSSGFTVWLIPGTSP